MHRLYNKAVCALPAKSCKSLKPQNHSSDNLLRLNTQPPLFRQVIQCLFRRTV